MLDEEGKRDGDKILFSLFESALQILRFLNQPIFAALDQFNKFCNEAQIAIGDSERSRLASP